MHDFCALLLINPGPRAAIRRTFRNWLRLALSVCGAQTQAFFKRPIVQSAKIRNQTGHASEADKGFVNPPIFRGSAMLLPDRRGPARRPRRVSLWARAVAIVSGHDHPALDAEGRRSSAGDRQCRSALAQFLQRHARPLRRRDHFFDPRRAVQRCGSTSGLRMSMTSRSISNAAWPG